MEFLTQIIKNETPYHGNIFLQFSYIFTSTKQGKNKEINKLGDRDIVKYETVSSIPMKDDFWQMITYTLLISKKWRTHINWPKNMY